MLAECRIDRLGERVGVQVGATTFFGAMTSKEITTRGVKGHPGVVYKIGVHTLAVSSAACLAATVIGAHSTMSRWEFTLHAHRDLLGEFSQHLHGGVQDFVQRDVLSEEEGPVTSSCPRQVLPRRVLDGIGVSVEGRHDGRRRPDEEAGSGADVSEEELELEDEEDVEGARRWWMSAARRTKSAR